MARIVLQSFDGEIPRMEPHYLPEKNAAEAANCKLTNGAISPMRDGVVVQGGLTGVQGIVYHDNQWFDWQQVVDAVPGPVADDRLYLTRSPEAPQVYVSGVWYPLKFSSPTVRPVRSWTGTPSDTAETVNYAYTFVSSFGEETGPSPLSFGTPFSEGVEITISDMPNGASINNRTVVNKRIYRSQTSAAGITDLYFIAEIPQADTSFTDIWGDNPIQEPCPTKNYHSVNDFLNGLTSMANGIMAGFSGKTLHFCEPYQPHMWPTEYQLVLEWGIRALVALGTSLVVLTDGEPYIVQGLHPDSMAMQKVDSIYPCLSRRSVVDMGYSAVYASTDGLVQISEGGAQLISKHLWSKDDWTSMRPNQMRGGRFGDDYIFTTVPIGSGWVRTVFTVSLDSESPALTRTNIPVDFFYNEPKTNTLYYVPVTQDSINEYDAGAAIPYVWKSKLFRFSDPISFSALLLDLTGSGTPVADDLMHIEYQDQLIAVLDQAAWTNVDQRIADVTVDDPPAVIVAEDTYTATIDFDAQVAESFTFKIYGDGSQIHQTSNGSNEVQRIPAGEYRSWQFSIEGTAEVLRAIIGQSPNEVWV